MRVLSCIKVCCSTDAIRLQLATAGNSASLQSTRCWLLTPVMAGCCISALCLLLLLLS